MRNLTGWCGYGTVRPRADPLPSLGLEGLLTQAQEGEEVEPEEAQDGSSQGLVHSREMEPLLQLGREVGKVEVVPVHHVLEQDVDEACRDGAVSSVPFLPGWLSVRGTGAGAAARPHDPEGGQKA